MSATTRKSTKTKSNFGVHGWLLVLYGFMGFMLGGSFWTSNALNEVVPELAASSGMDSAMLLNGATAANLIAIPIFLLIGVLYNKFGTRKIHTALMIIPGICLLFFGNTTTYTMYLFLLTILATTTNAVNLSGLPQIYANYFPTKKGLIMGWATSGSAGGAIIALPLLIALGGKFGFSVALIIFGVFMIVLGIINAIFIPDKPEQMGKKPDNGDITEEELAHLREENETAELIWTIREALKNKNFWLLAVGYGLMFLLTAGIMMQMVPYQMSQGMEQGKAVATISVVALLGIFGSAFSGWLDQKIGVKRTGILLGVAYALACFFGGVMPYTTVTNVLFIAIYGAFMGSISNLPMSHAVSIFGVKFYPKIWTLIMPIMRLIASFAASILAYFQAATGSFRGAYAAFMVMAIVSSIILVFTNQSLEKKPGKPPVVLE